MLYDARMKASDLLVRCLENEGVTHIFGVPGEENADFMLSLQGSSIHFILCRHEQGAAFMADAYGRLTGNPAGCLGTLGPGATNLLTGVANANMDHAPMLVLTGQGATTRQHKESHQVMNVVEMMRPVTKWAHAIYVPANIPELVRKAVRLTRTEKCGAVHLEMAENVAELDAPEDATPLEVRRFIRPESVPWMQDRAAEAIRRARKPIIIAGNGAIRKRASNELRAFCELTGIGVASTFMGKGCVDCDAPYYLYTIGLQAKDHVATAVADADLVLAVGYDLVEYPPHLWNLGCDKTILHIDFLPAEIDRHYHPQIELVGDIAGALAGLTDRLSRDSGFDFDLSGQAEARRRMHEELLAAADEDGRGLIKPQKVVADVRAALSHEDILFSGVGAHKMWVARHYHCHEPNTCIIPNGFCSMGMALPGAIGAHVAREAGLLNDNHARIFAIAGDGDFLMNVQEMETAQRLEADITVMVWEDGGYNLISWKQQTEFGRHTDLSFGNPDWIGLAKSFGWQGQVVDEAKELAPAIEAALTFRGPSLIVVPIDYRENPKLTQRLGKIERAL